jgi:predicted nucleic acid-binding protein
MTYNVLPMDGDAFRLHAKLMHGRSDTLSEDGMIAAIAKSNGLTVVTRNIRDFLSFDVDTFNPFIAAQS